MDETGLFDITPVQFAILNALMDDPGEDQVTLAARVALDAATAGSVIGRLEAKGWVRREADPADRRRKLIWVTTAGEKVVSEMMSDVTASQLRIFSPLDEAEGRQLRLLLVKLVKGHQPDWPAQAS